MLMYGWLETPAVTIAAGSAIALLGLPHGAMDLQVLARSYRVGRQRFAAVTALYLTCAAVMALAWWAAPVAALAFFLLIAVVHFGEDWQAAEQPFLQHGMALALLATPALLHKAATAAIFVALTGTSDAALVADALLVVAPVALVVAVTAIAAMAANGAYKTVASAVLSLAALAVLPPALGFAVYFCLFHSPQHFAQRLRLLGWSRARQWLPVVVPVTALAFAIVAGLFALVPATGVSARFVAAIFMTLSVLTLPHVAVPILLDAGFSRWQPRRRARSIASGR